MKTDLKKHFSFLEWITVIGFSLLFLFTLYTSSQEFFKKPLREKFCRDSWVDSSLVASKVSCENRNGTWIEGKEKIKGNALGEYCDLQKKCNDEYEKSHHTYTMNEYILIGIISLLGIIFGYLIRRKSQLASFALIAASIFSIIVSHITHWELVSGYMRPIILILALSLVMYGIIKRDSKSEEKYE